MEFIKLQPEQVFRQDKKLNERFESFEKLIVELEKKDIPLAIVQSINSEINEINSFSGSAKDMLKLIRKTQSAITNRLEKELKLVPKNHFRNRWLALGMSAFGIPIGVAFGISMGNMGLLGIGLPIGLGIGVALGTVMDNKAKESGKQLDVDLKY